jgi:hypothetical protein
VENVVGETKNQALNALVFLYREVCAVRWMARSMAVLLRAGFQAGRAALTTPPTPLALAFADEAPCEAPNSKHQAPEKRQSPNFQFSQRTPD